MFRSMLLQHVPQLVVLLLERAEHLAQRRLGELAHARLLALRAVHHPVQRARRAGVGTGLSLWGSPRHPHTARSTQHAHPFHTTHCCISVCSVEPGSKP